jgi:hypothetical protein
MAGGRFFMGLGIGYVLGTKAGKERYDQLVRLYENVSSSPKIEEFAKKAKGSLPRDLQSVPGIGNMVQKTRGTTGEESSPAPTDQTS